MNFVMLLHCAASSRASPVVILRQLLSPKPSASANVIFLEPHHDGPLPRRPPQRCWCRSRWWRPARTSSRRQPLLLVEELEPHAATATTIPRASRLDIRAFALHCINVSTLSVGSLV